MGRFDMLPLDSSRDGAGVAWASGRVVVRSLTGSVTFHLETWDTSSLCLCL